MTTELWLQLGPHRYRVSGDIFEWEPHGLLEVRYAEPFVALLLERLAKCPYLAVLVDGRDLHPLPPEVRQLYVKTLRGLADVRTMFVVSGAGWMTQITQTLAMRAAMRLARIPIEFQHVNTRDQGMILLRQWLGEHQVAQKRSYT